MHLIIGLWNPGLNYEKTRHNAGFIAIDSLRSNWNFEEWKDSKFKWVISEWMYHGEKIILLKPLTFMNLSWESVSLLVNFYKIPKEHILILSDDLDMEFWKVRFREKWSHGWQRGIKSIIEHLWTDVIGRIKIGIGRDDRYEVSDWVLSRFNSDELGTFEKDIIPEVQQKIDSWLE
jgi:PTH1 family peptidyl-tRNA hydrolase